MRLYEEPELASIEEKVAEERKMQRAKAAINRLKDLGLTPAEIKAALAG